MSEVTIHDHERRITVMEAGMEQMTSRLEVAEMFQPLYRKLDAMESSFLHFMQSTEHQYGELSNTVKRQVEQNEEYMRVQARHEQELHAKELEAKDQALEASKPLNKLKVLAAWALAFSVISGAAVTAWVVALWIIHNLLK